MSIQHAKEVPFGFQRKNKKFQLRNNFFRRKKANTYSRFLHNFQVQNNVYLLLLFILSFHGPLKHTSTIQIHLTNEIQKTNSNIFNITISSPPPHSPTHTLFLVDLLHNSKSGVLFSRHGVLKFDKSRVEKNSRFRTCRLKLSKVHF